MRALPQNGRPTPGPGIAFTGAVRVDDNFLYLSISAVTQATAGGDAEIGEDGMLRVNVGDAEGFFAGTEAALVDFVVVRGAPVVWGGDFDAMGFLRSRCHAPIISGGRAESTRSCCQLFTGGSPVVRKTTPGARTALPARRRK